MSNPLLSVHVKRFKGIKDAPFDVSAINSFIGANNSGKSTLAQIIHFGIGIFQSIQLAGRWGNSQSVALSLSPAQLLYLLPVCRSVRIGFGWATHRGS
jgi:predicted ATPase